MADVEVRAGRNEGINLINDEIGELFGGESLINGGGQIDPSERTLKKTLFVLILQETNEK